MVALTLAICFFAHQIPLLALRVLRGCDEDFTGWLDAVQEAGILRLDDRCWLKLFSHWDQIALGTN